MLEYLLALQDHLSKQDLLDLLAVTQFERKWREEATQAPETHHSKAVSLKGGIAPDHTQAEID